MIKIYISPSCLSSKKVIQFFDKHKIPYIKRNIIHNPLNDTEIKLLLRFVPNGVGDIISTRAKFIKTHAINIEKLTMLQVFDLIKTSPTVLKRPIIIQENKQRIQIGYNEDEIELFLRGSIENEFEDSCEIF